MRTLCFDFAPSEGHCGCRLGPDSLGAARLRLDGGDPADQTSLGIHSPRPAGRRSFLSVLPRSDRPASLASRRRFMPIWLIIAK